MKHIPDQVKYHRIPLTASGAWDQESSYSKTGDYIHSGRHGITQFHKRWLEEMDVKGLIVKEKPVIETFCWAEINTDKGSVYRIVKTEDGGVERPQVLVAVYKHGKPTIPPIDMPEHVPPIKCNVGRLMGRWKVKLEPTHEWVYEDIFRQNMANKSKYTPCIFFELDRYGYSQHMMHKMVSNMEDE